MCAVPGGGSLAGPQLTKSSRGADRRPGRRRILVVSPFVPSRHGTHGAGIAIAGHLEGLAASSEIDVGLFHLRGDDEPDVDACLAAQLTFVRGAGRPIGAHAPFERLRLVHRLLHGTPMWIQHWWSSSVTAAFRSTIAEFDPGAVVIFMGVMWPALELVPTTTTTALVVLEPTVDAAGNELARHRGVLRWLHRADLIAWRRTERHGAQRASVVITLTERDREVILRQAPGARTAVVPLGGWLPEHPADPIGEPAGGVLFVGSARHYPNVDAVRWLSTDIGPRLSERMPDAEVHIVGAFEVDEEAAGATGLIRHGRVQEIAPFLERAQIVVAPLRLGGGMRVKVLEALAAGKAVVGTSLAFAGIDAPAHGAARVADDSETFVRVLAELLADPELRADLGGRARAWAEEHLSWERSSAALLTAVGYDRADASRRP